MTPPEPPQENLNTRHLNLPSDLAPGDLGTTTGPLDLQRPWVIEFRVVGTASTVKARVADAMILGRGDTANSYAPEVDLTPFDAFAKGVSRKHALISIKDQRLMLRDLNSTNGTRLNNVLCTPGEEYRVRHGSELTLGTLRLQVSFAVVPAFTDTQHGGLGKQQEISVLSHFAGKRLLVVESDPDVGSVFRSALENVGYKVTLVDDVVKGFGVVFQGMPDAVILDLMEPDTTGLDLIRFVRKQISPQHIPILAVSGALAGFQMNQALSAGADSFLGKPVSVEALLEAVAKAWSGQPAAELGDKVTGRLDKPETPQPADALFPAPSTSEAPTTPPAPPVAKPDAPPPPPAPPAGQIKPVAKPDAPPTPPAPPAGQIRLVARPEAAPMPPAGQVKPVEKVAKPDAPPAPSAPSQAQEMAKSVALPVKPESVVPKPDALPRIKPLSSRL